MAMQCLTRSACHAGQRQYDSDKGSPPNVAIDAWAEAERVLQAGMGIREVLYPPNLPVCK